MKWICDDQEVARSVGIPWARDRIGLLRPFEQYAKAIMLLDDQKLLAVTVYTDYAPRNISLHIASNGSKRWLTRAFLLASFDYPFDQLGVRRVTGLVAASNPAALKFDLHLGFRVEGRMRGASEDGSDLLVLGMLRHECRYLRAKHGQEQFCTAGG